MNTEVEYAIGRVMKVRRLAGNFRVIDSWLVGGSHNRRRRYKLAAVEGTGAKVSITESFSEDMGPVADPQPTELTLVPESFPSEAIPAGLHIPDATAAQEHVAPSGHIEPGSVAAQPVADAIRSPADAAAADIRAMNRALEEGSFDEEFDDYSVGARVAEEPGELKNPFQSVRKFPENPTYQDLKCIVYSSRFKGLEKLGTNQLARLEGGTPIAVAVTHETNGHAIWVITTEAADEVRRARLEVFYPHAQGSSADAVEYAVLLALRQIPIRTVDLEILLLSI